jgi:hypothetical protein
VSASLLTRYTTMTTPGRSAPSAGIGTAGCFVPADLVLQFVLLPTGRSLGQ